MRRIILSWLIFVLLFTVNAFAEVSIKAQVNKIDISADETITYKCVVNADVQEKIPDPKLPAFEGFDVLSRIQSSNISLGKGKAKVEVSFSFILLPNKSGKLKIEPASISLKNEVYTSEGFEINVSGEIKRKPAPKEIPVASGEPQFTL